MAERAELEAAAGALLTYHLGGQRTDDALLAQIQAAWVEYEALRQEQQECVLLQVGRGRQAARGSSVARSGWDWVAGCRRRWTATLPAGVPGLTGTPGRTLHQTVSTDAGVAARSVEPSPRVQTEVEVAAVEPAPYCLG